MLLIVTSLPATGILNDKTTWFVKENNSSDAYPSSPANYPDLITINIVAQVTEVNDQYNLLGGVLKVNDTIKGKYTYDSLTDDEYPGNPDIGIYWQNLSSCVFEIKAGGFVFKTNVSDIQYVIGIFDNVSYYYDSYIVISNNNLPLSNGMFVSNILWWLSDETCNALSSDVLPTIAPDLSKWSFNELYITGFDPTTHNSFEIVAHVTKVTKSKAKDAYFIGHPVLIWLLERFQNMFPILRNLIKL